jgi:hypothetical protein
MRTTRFYPLLFILAACSPAKSSYDDPWFNPAGGEWVPDASVVARMKLALDHDFRSVFEARKNSRISPKRYWFQYVGTSSGADPAILIIGRPFPVPAHADSTFFNAMIPEECQIVATYLPKERKFKDSSLGGFNCPPRI